MSLLTDLPTAIRDGGRPGPGTGLARRPPGAPHADRRQGHLWPGCLVAGGSLPLSCPGARAAGPLCQPRRATPGPPRPAPVGRPGAGGAGRPRYPQGTGGRANFVCGLLKAGGPPAGAGLAGGPPVGTCATCAVRYRKAVTHPPSRAPCSPRTARRPGRHPPPRGRALPTGTPPRRGSRRRRSPAPRRTSAAS